MSQSEDEGVKLDLLKAPSSPAANLLGIAASDVDKPTDVSAFMLSLRSATSNFTALPSNYAIDLAPYWLFKKKKGDITAAGLENSFGKNVFKQTLVLSFAIRNTDSTEIELTPNSIYGGVGFKFSIFRGNYDETTKKALKEIKLWQDVKLDILKRQLGDYNNDVDVIVLEGKREELLRKAVNDYRDSIKATDEFENATLRQIDSATRRAVPGISARVRNSKEYFRIDTALNNKLAELNKTSKTEADEKIKEVASNFQTARVSFTWDISGGISGQFIDKSINNSKFYNAGIWTTIGYTGEKYGSGLFLLRLLHNPDKIFAKDNALNEIGDITTFDAGLRYIYGRSQSKFNASLEAIYRSVLSSGTIDPSWRVVFNAEYAIWQNQKLTFSFGRNFDGTISNDGNLIAALSFLAGFGNKR